MSPGSPSSNDLDAILETAREDRKRLDSGAMGAFSLTMLGVASVVGAGIFVTTGEAAADYAGPAVLISFLLAGLVAGLTALCYAELAAMIPAAGSTYSYAYAAFGSFVAWFIGWDLLLEYLFAASTVAVGWSGYFVSLMSSIGIHIPHSLSAPPFGSDPGVVNVPAIAIMLLTSAGLWLGQRESARANNAMVVLKLTILLLVVAVGAFYVSSANLSPFVPPHGSSFSDYGLGGIFRGAGVVFFAYVGFDAVSTAAGESRNPQRTIPIGLLGTVLISTVLYIAVGFILTGMVDYHRLGVADPIAAAVASAGPHLDWLLRLVDVAAVVGLASTVLVTLYGQTRIFMRMSEDGMLPARFGKVDSKRQTPHFSIILCGIVGGIVAGFVPISVLGQLISIGTLMAFVIVAAGVMRLRRTRPELPRPFRIPALPVIATLAIVSALALMATLPGDTWIRLVVWMTIGVGIYFSYARRSSAARMAEMAARARARRSAEAEPPG